MKYTGRKRSELRDLHQKIFLQLKVNFSSVKRHSMRCANIQTSTHKMERIKIPQLHPSIIKTFKTRADTPPKPNILIYHNHC
jgi:hypothetical protein